jgi:MFS family permease
MNAIKIKSGLILIYATTIFSGLVVVPILPNIAEITSLEFSQFFFVLPSLVAIPFLFIAKILNLFMCAKRIVLTGLVLYVFSGLALMLLDYWWWLLFFRGLCGVAAAFIVPYTSILITDIYKDKEKDNLLAYGSVMTYGFAVIIFYFISYLIVLHWKLTFLVYFVALAPAILIHKYVPWQQTKKVQLNKASFFKTINFNYKIWLSFLAMFFLTFWCYTFYSNITILSKQQGFSSGYELSIAQAFVMMAGIFSNLGIRFIKKLNFLYVQIFIISFIIIAFLLLSNLSINKQQLYIASLLFGLGFSIIGSSSYIYASNYSTTENKDNALFILTLLSFSGIVLGPLYSNKLLAMVGIINISYIFLSKAFILFLLLISVLFFYTIGKKYKQKSIP